MVAPPPNRRASSNGLWGKKQQVSQEWGSSRFYKTNDEATGTRSGLSSVFPWRKGHPVDHGRKRGRPVAKAPRPAPSGNQNSRRSWPVPSPGPFRPAAPGTHCRRRNHKSGSSGRRGDRPRNGGTSPAARSVPPEPAAFCTGSTFAPPHHLPRAQPPPLRDFPARAYAAVGFLGGASANVTTTQSTRRIRRPIKKLS